MCVAPRSQLGAGPVPRDDGDQPEGTTKAEENPAWILLFSLVGVVQPRPNY